MESVASLPRLAGWSDLWLPRLLLAIGIVSAACGGLVGLFDPWVADPERGLQASAYSHDWVHWHLQYGLGVTLGAPLIHVAPGNPPVAIVNWHHPAGYTLWLLPFAWLFGNEPWVLRSAHMIAFLPSVYAAYRLVARHTDRWLGGVAAALYGTCPYAIYFGTQVLQDGCTLSLAILTAWAFQRHLDAPQRVRWWWPGLWFFLCGANDIPGYFIGGTMLGLALLHRPLWPALRSVALMFLVALATFAATALHFGLFLGGPFGWIESMLRVAGHERHLLAATDWSEYGAQWRRILGEFGAWPVIVLAAVGALAAMLVADARRLVALGFVVAVPGIASYLVFFAHAPDHVYWPVPAFGGVAIMATAVAALARQAWRRRGAGRWLAAVLATACAAAGVFGAIRCQTLIGASATELVRAHGHVAAAAPLARGCDYVLTTASTGFGRFFGDGMVIGGVQQVERLDDVLRVAESAGLQAEVAFLLERPWFGTPLHDRLQSLAVPVSGDQVLVYRFKVPR